MTRAISLSTLLSMSIVYLFTSHTFVSAQQSDWLPYEPTVVQIEGKLLKVIKYGPPGYGENPKRDIKYEVPILLTSEPVRVKGNLSNPKSQADLTNVSFIQLVFPKSSGNYRRYLDKEIVVEGTLFRAETGGHYTDLLMNVQTIRAKGK